MTIGMKLLIRVIRRRMEKGETLSQILQDYPRITDEEHELILDEFKSKNETEKTSDTE